MLLPSEDSKRSDLDLQHRIESEIHSLSKNLGSPIGLGADELEAGISRLNSLLDLFRRRDEIVKSLIDGSAEDRSAWQRRQLLTERARLGKNFNQAINTLSQSLRLRLISIGIQAQLRQQVLRSRRLSTSLTPAQLLIVDNDYDTCEMLKVTLEMSGYTVMTVRSKAEALQWLRRRTFDLCILDNWLPYRSGIELCQEIRKSDSKMPIIFYSGAGSQADRQAGINAGAQAYLVKPVVINELEQTIARFLEKSERNSAKTKIWSDH